VFHNTTPDLQDQDHFFWSETGLVLRPNVSDHITGDLVKSYMSWEVEGIRENAQKRPGGIMLRMRWKV